MKQHIAFLAILSLFLLNGCDKKAEPEPTPKEEEKKLEPTLTMQFEKTSLDGIGFMDIIFTGDGRAAALSTRKEVFFSKDDGKSWELVKSYPTTNNDTTIQSLALNPTQDVIFLGANFLHNGDNNLRHVIIKRENNKWQKPIIITPSYDDGKGNRPKFPVKYHYNHSFWFHDYVINSFSDDAGLDGFVSRQQNPEKTDTHRDQQVMFLASKNSFVATSVIPIQDGYDKLYNCAGSEILPSKVRANTRIYQWHNFTWMTSNSSDNTNRPDCCVPDYMAASPDLKGSTFSKLMLYTGLGKLYHTHIAPAAHHQQEIILNRDIVGYGNKLCVGIDNKRHVWLGTEKAGMFRSVTPLP